MTQAVDSLRGSATADPVSWTTERTPSPQDFVNDNVTLAFHGLQAGSATMAVAGVSNGSLTSIWLGVAAYSFCSIMLGHEFAKAEKLHAQRQGETPGNFVLNVARKSLRHLSPF